MKCTFIVHFLKSLMTLIKINELMRFLIPCSEFRAPVCNRSYKQYAAYKRKYTHEMLDTDHWTPDTEHSWEFVGFRGFRKYFRLNLIKRIIIIAIGRASDAKSDCGDFSLWEVKTQIHKRHVSMFSMFHAKSTNPSMNAIQNIKEPKMFEKVIKIFQLTLLSKALTIKIEIERF